MKLFRYSLIATLSCLLFLSFNLFPIISLAQSSNSANKFQTLMQADQLYLDGKISAAEQLYRKVKPAFPKDRASAVQMAITDPEKLSGASKVYWRNAQEGMQQGLESKIFAPLEMLLEKQPEFTPAYSLYAEAARKYDKKDKILPILEQGASLFPDSVELTKALIKEQEREDQWLEASITARQFAVVYPKHAEASEFNRIAEDDFKRFRRRLNKKIITQGILSGAIGILTGDNGAQLVNLAPMMLQGESGVGEQLSAAYRQQATLINDPAVVDYVARIGNDIASLMGRNDFKYEFYVVQDNTLNAFALPGGKVFVNTGIIMAANSEAELAGLMGHEVSHAVLSHGFQRITKANLLSSISKQIPLGNVLSTLVTLDYSRQNERQADIVGTRVLATAGYAADGLRNLFVTMKHGERKSKPTYLSTHPATDVRVRSLEELIQRNGYNRYAFEGIKRHSEIKKRLQQILQG